MMVAAGKTSPQNQSQPEGRRRLQLPQPVAALLTATDAVQSLRQAVHQPEQWGPKHYLLVLFLAFHQGDAELRHTAVSKLQQWQRGKLAELLRQEELPQEAQDFALRARHQDVDFCADVLGFCPVSRSTLLWLAQRPQPELLRKLAGCTQALEQDPQLAKAIHGNPQVDPWTQVRVEMYLPGGMGAENTAGDQAETEEEVAEEDAASKYEQIQHMTVPEKIKMALTGDKEWRSLLLKESNKQVSTAVLDNPRMSEDEVLMLAQNRSTREELIRIILRNREWMKNRAIKLALIYHPRTPPNRALRMLDIFSDRELKQLAKSRDVSPTVATAAQRLLKQKEEKRQM